MKEVHDSSSSYPIPLPGTPRCCCHLWHKQLSTMVAEATEVERWWRLHQSHRASWSRKVRRSYRARAAGEGVVGEH
ncbi:hypothetical protein E2562_032123 [Oryza meyeriana var. granulata]|uniref:Uncharacterized protein n=1 Tax=Oryza meyeriana var. granulata TaxID=110450 RepID=A0A6G1CKG1_9ORYZ|nr:hypothetical protein E2562_032123 [Oryza meyeriana var. granulata]